MLCSGDGPPQCVAVLNACPGRGADAEATDSGGPSWLGWHSVQPLMGGHGRRWGDQKEAAVVA